VAGAAHASSSSRAEAAADGAAADEAADAMVEATGPDAAPQPTATRARLAMKAAVSHRLRVMGTQLLRVRVGRRGAVGAGEQFYLGILSVA
jgi:hypothetical protein